MSTRTEGDLTIIHNELTDGVISVYRGDVHLGLVFPLLRCEAIPTDTARPAMRHRDVASAIAYLAE